MKEEYRSYIEEAYDIVKHAANVIGPRLPGGENERKFHKYMADKLGAIGIKAKTEPFAVSPRASIGGIPYIGTFGFIISILIYFAFGLGQLWYGMALFTCASWFWIISSVFLYKRWCDEFFPRCKSQNTYGELLPPDGKYDYTIFLSGHTDTSWNWNHSVKTYNHKRHIMIGVIGIYAKVGFGAVCYVFLTLVCIFMAFMRCPWFFDVAWRNAIADSAAFSHFVAALHFLPLITAWGCSFLYMWNNKKEENASPGAMDNATGIGLSYAVTKYFHDNPDKMPKNCRIIDFNCGAEEAGLRGSMAFADEHKGEDILKNAWNINIDSVADDEYFEVVIKDDWQFTRFDKDLEQMFKDTFKELNIESKTGGCIHNPVGGCDSTPFTKAGVKSVTFAAQNPMLTYYYHTFRDTPDRFSPETVGRGFEVVLGVIDKIGKFQEEHGYNGVNN